MVREGSVSRTTLRASKTPINTVEFSKLWKHQREVGGVKTLRQRKKGSRKSLTLWDAFPQPFQRQHREHFSGSPLEAILPKLAKE